MDADNSWIAGTNTSSQPAKSPGRASGRVTLRNVRSQPAPVIRAVSSSVGAEEIDEGDRGEEGRRHVRDDGGQVDEPLGRNVGAAHRPGQRDTDGDAEDGGPQAEDEGIAKGLDVEAAAQRLAKVLQRGSAGFTHATPNHGRQRQHDQDEQGQNRDRHDDVLDPDEAADGGDQAYRCWGYA
jgi:hypothetical protein